MHMQMILTVHIWPMKANPCLFCIRKVLLQEFLANLLHVQQQCHVKVLVKSEMGKVSNVTPWDALKVRSCQVFLVSENDTQLVRVKNDVFVMLCHDATEGALAS